MNLSFSLFLTTKKIKPILPDLGAITIGDFRLHQFWENGGYF